MKSFETLLVSAALTIAATQTSAMTQDFTVDLANSSVTLTETGSGGLACWLSSCGIEASLAPGLGTELSPLSFTLADSDPAKIFDFILFEMDGTSLSGKSFDITATLAFAPPTASGTSGGSGRGYALAGSIFGGVLTWDEPMPMEITAGNGAVFNLGFDGGAGFLIGDGPDYTLSASVDLISGAVPLPAGFLLLGTALGGLGLAHARRRKG